MIIGHQRQWQRLEKSFGLNRLAHAYLFSGLPGLGKKTLAIEFIKLISCQSEGKKRPCQECNACKMIEKRNYPELTIIESKNNDDSIQISQIRQLQQFLSYKPHYGPFKTAIIDGAEKMTKDSQNCFLKTLEEPKGNTLLILISSLPDVLLPTIFSRCQTIKFFPASIQEIKDFLLKKDASLKKAEELAIASRGRPAKAVNLFLNPEQLGKEQKILKEISEFCQLDLASRFQYAKSLASKEDVLQIGNFLESIQDYFRSVLLLKIGAENLALPVFPAAEGPNSYSLLKLKKIIRSIQTIKSLIFSTNVNQRLALETLMMEL